MASFARTALGLTLGAAMLVGQPTSLSLTPAPAAAKERCGYDSDGRWRCRDGGIDVEDIVVGAAVIAGIAVLANEVFNDAKDDYGRGRGWGFDNGRGGARSAAVDACARTAENEARRYGGSARVRNIDDVDRDGSRYRVRGTVEVDRGGWSDRTWDNRGWDDRRDDRYTDRAKFTCTARDGRVTAFRFTDGFNYAYRY